MAALISTVTLALAAFLPLSASAQEVSAKEDYVTCWKQPCIYTPAIEWSVNNPSGVAIAVAMGTQAVVTDDQIKEVLIRDFKNNGLTNLKFFFEQNDTPASGITFHVRGGTEGIYLIDNVRDKIATTSKRAKNTNPLFR